MKLIRNTFALALGLTLTAGLAQGETVQVDTDASHLQWTGSKVIGDSHTGKLKVKSGNVTFNDGAPSQGNLVIDMASLTNEDLTDAQWNAKLVGHLKSDDFFSVEKHPEAKLAITKITTKSNGEFELTGKLTVKGKTETLTTTAKRSKNKAGKDVITAKLKFDRTKFDVRYGSGKFFQNLGDKMIADDVEVEATIVLEKSGFKTAAN